MKMEPFKNNTTFYDGLEDEPEIKLKIAEVPGLIIHIWDGYFCDILGNPSFCEDGWKGFTKDYQEGVRSYGNEETRINVSEYLSDLETYRNNTFELAETENCLELICDFLKYAKEQDYTVIVSWWS